MKKPFSQLLFKCTTTLQTAAVCMQLSIPPQLLKNYPGSSNWEECKNLYKKLNCLTLEVPSLAGSKGCVARTGSALKLKLADFAQYFALMNGS